jgi:hypothetical protein
MARGPAIIAPDTDLSGCIRQLFVREMPISAGRKYENSDRCPVTSQPQ